MTHPRHCPSETQWLCERITRKCIDLVSLQFEYPFMPAPRSIPWAYAIALWAELSKPRRLIVFDESETRTTALRLVASDRRGGLTCHYTPALSPIVSY